MLKMYILLFCDPKLPYYFKSWCVISEANMAKCEYLLNLDVVAWISVILVFSAVFYIF